jgi:hypothetical protein
VGGRLRQGPAPGPATPSRRAGEGQAVFENAGHDFPQRIRHERRTATVLHVHLEGVEGGAAHAEDLDLSRVDCS